MYPSLDKLKAEENVEKENKISVFLFAVMNALMQDLVLLQIFFVSTDYYSGRFNNAVMHGSYRTGIPTVVPVL